MLVVFPGVTRRVDTHFRSVEAKTDGKSRLLPVDPGTTSKAACRLQGLVARFMVSQDEEADPFAAEVHLSHGSVRNGRGRRFEPLAIPDFDRHNDS